VTNTIEAKPSSGLCLHVVRLLVVIAVFIYFEMGVLIYEIESNLVAVLVRAVPRSRVAYLLTLVTKKKERKHETR
jgi:membrane-anchored glycerophosphoryl diester phosphodiesterase (GDPDase)